jgi:hypothetical protein
LYGGGTARARGVTARQSSEEDAAALAATSAVYETMAAPPR